MLRGSGGDRNESFNSRCSQCTTWRRRRHPAAQVPDWRKASWDTTCFLCKDSMLATQSTQSNFNISPPWFASIPPWCLHRLEKSSGMGPLETDSLESSRDIQTLGSPVFCVLWSSAISGLPWTEKLRGREGGYLFWTSLSPPSHVSTSNVLVIRFWLSTFQLLALYGKDSQVSGLCHAAVQNLETLQHGDPAAKRCITRHCDG